MKKIIFFLIIFFALVTESLSKINKSNNTFIGCNSEVGYEYLTNIDKLKIKKIEIDTENYRRWAVNSIRIITTPSRFIPDRYKRRFNATITVTYENENKCIFKGRIRHSGDAKDHIALHGNSIIQSLDVHLINGNIRGVTKFKLFKPDTRGKLQDVIIITELLRSLNYLGPRSIKVDARINQAESTMLFQEKASKELLEYNNRREGPILDADQKFFFKLVDKIPDNELSNWDLQMPALRSKSIKTMLTKQINSEIISKSENHKAMSYDALTNLNYIYLYYSNRFKDKKNNFYYFDYDLDNTLLGFFNRENIKKLDKYNLLMQATNSQHGLSASNRKFYWNSIENYFEPVSYDLNANIDSDFASTTSSAYRLPVSDYFLDTFDELKYNLENLNFNKLITNVNLSGANITEANLQKKIEKILANIDRIKKNYSNFANNEMVEHNKYEPRYNILSGFSETLVEIDPNVYVVTNKQTSQKNNILQRCKINLQNCEDYSFSNDDLSELLEGELVLDKKIYQYLGNNQKFESLKKDKNYNKLELSEFTVFYENGIEIDNKQDQRILDINQKKPGSRLYIVNGKLEDILINFNGYNLSEDKKTLDLKSFPPNYPVDINGLTGCLSLVNLSVKNISIKADNSSCEDTVNFINVNGHVKEINIKDSFSDGLDVDFSNLKFDNINVSSSGNDCADFSAGDYEIKNLNLKNCGDKALSVGEKSLLTLNKINAENASIGVASKDSSIVGMNNVYLKNLKTCIAAYNKKQEFNGGYIEIENMNCENYNQKANVDKYSKVVEKNKKL